MDLKIAPAAWITVSGRPTAGPFDHISPLLRLIVSILSIMSSHTALEAALATALNRWNRPFPGFTSGRDPRTSDQSLLALVYGGLEHAARYDWLNAGRRLIDKTYIDMLWHVQDLTNMRTVRPEQIAAALDGVIEDSVRPVWSTLPDLDEEERFRTAGVMVDQIASRCFRSVRSEVAASRLAFFLFPMLPVFNLSRGHLLALDRLGHAPAADSYDAFARAAAVAYREILPELQSLPRPAVSVPDAQQSALINELLDESDWWTRRIFDEYLRGYLHHSRTDMEHIYGCDSAGGLISDVPSRMN
jgi:hypothetical protein